MEHGLIILIIIASIIVIHFFGFKIFLLCVFATILIVIGVFFYQIFESEGRFKKFKQWRKRNWTKYEKFEDKLFRWFDNI